MKLVGVLLCALVACDPPQPSLELELSAGPAQECPSTDCSEIAMSCRMFMSVRILEPDDAMAPFHSECLPIPMTIAGTLCTIGGLELQEHTLPYRDLEVQVAIYPEDVVTRDPVSGLYSCPTGTTYDAANGFPISGTEQVTPALGGRGYYRPGDDTIRITLGCSNIEELDRCTGVAAVSVNATVDDFDTHLSVSSSEARTLDVRVGQPSPQGGTFVLDSNEATELVRTLPNMTAWSGTVNELFTSHACLTVRDDNAPQPATSVTCRRARVTDTLIELNGANAGVRIENDSLDQILATMSLASLPTEGLTIGVVVDGGVPVGGQVVAASEGTIEYLGADRSTIGGVATSGGPRGGVFVSRDAPFGATFSTSRAIPPATATKIGGRIQNKVTIVVLDLSNGGTQPE